MHDLCKNAEASTLREMRKSLLKIKTTEWQIEVKRFKSFRLHNSKGENTRGNFAGVKLSQA